METKNEELKEEVQTGSTEQEEVKKDGEETAVANASEQEETSSEEESIDYKAELEKVSEERDNYKKGMLSAKDKLKNKGEEVNEEELLSNVDKVVEERVGKFQADLLKDATDDMLDSLSSSPEEKELIQFHYENTIRKTGFNRASIKSDLSRAKLLANEKKLVRENAEMKETLTAKKSMTESGGTNQDRQEDISEVKLSPRDNAVAERAAKRKGISVAEWLKTTQK